MSTEPDRPMPDHQLEAFRRDPYDCVAGEVIQLVNEIDRLRAAYEPLGDKWGWCIECDAPWDPAHRFQPCRRIPLYLRKADL